MVSCSHFSCFTTITFPLYHLESFFCYFFLLIFSAYTQSHPKIPKFSFFLFKFVPNCWISWISILGKFFIHSFIHHYYPLSLLPLFAFLFFPILISVLHFFKLKRTQRKKSFQKFIYLRKFWFFDFFYWWMLKSVDKFRQPISVKIWWLLENMKSNDVDDDCERKNFSRICTHRYRLTQDTDTQHPCGNEESCVWRYVCMDVRTYKRMYVYSRMCRSVCDYMENNMCKWLFPCQMPTCQCFVFFCFIFQNY